MWLQMFRVKQIELNRINRAKVNKSRISSIIKAIELNNSYEFTIVRMKVAQLNEVRGVRSELLRSLGKDCPDNLTDNLTRQSLRKWFSGTFYEKRVFSSLSSYFPSFLDGKKNFCDYEN